MLLSVKNRNQEEMWTEEQIKKFEKALRGPAPEWDPQWEVTQQLLKLVTVQTRHIINLQAQLDAMLESNTASTENLVNTLRQNMATSRQANKSLTAQEVKVAVDNLNSSIQAVANGQKALQYAGNVLRFVAKILI